MGGGRGEQRESERMGSERVGSERIHRQATRFEPLRRAHASPSNSFRAGRAPLEHARSHLLVKLTGMAELAPPFCALLLVNFCGGGTSGAELTLLGGMNAAGGAMPPPFNMALMGAPAVAAIPSIPILGCLILLCFTRCPSVCAPRTCVSKGGGGVNKRPHTHV